MDNSNKQRKKFELNRPLKNSLISGAIKNYSPYRKYDASTQLISEGKKSCSLNNGRHKVFVANSTMPASYQTQRNSDKCIVPVTSDFEFSNVGKLDYPLDYDSIKRTKKHKKNNDPYLNYQCFNLNSKNNFSNISHSIYNENFEIFLDSVSKCLTSSKTAFKRVFPISHHGDSLINLHYNSSLDSLPNYYDFTELELSLMQKMFCKCKELPWEKYQALIPIDTKSETMHLRDDPPNIHDSSTSKRVNPFFYQNSGNIDYHKLHSHKRRDENAKPLPSQDARDPFESVFNVEMLDDDSIMHFTHTEKGENYSGSTLEMPTPETEEITGMNISSIEFLKKKMEENRLNDVHEMAKAFPYLQKETCPTPPTQRSPIPLINLSMDTLEEQEISSPSSKEEEEQEIHVVIKSSPSPEALKPKEEEFTTEDISISIAPVYNPHSNPFNEDKEVFLSPTYCDASFDDLLVFPDIAAPPPNLNSSPVLAPPQKASSPVPPPIPIIQFVPQDDSNESYRLMEPSSSIPPAVVAKPCVSPEASSVTTPSPNDLNNIKVDEARLLSDQEVQFIMTNGNFPDVLSQYEKTDFSFVSIPFSVDNNVSLLGNEGSAMPGYDDGLSNIVINSVNSTSNGEFSEMLSTEMALSPPQNDFLFDNQGNP